LTITFFISNRASGKSQMAMYEFLKNPDETLFITHNRNMLRDIPHLFDYYKDRFVSQSEMFIGKNYKRVVMDEYLMFDRKNRERLYDALPAMVQEVFIFSTPQKIYKRSDYAFIKFIKKNGIALTNKTVKDYILDVKSETLADDLFDLYYNFITHPQANIINDQYFLNKEKYHQGKEIFGNNFDRIATECKGQFLKYE